MAESFNVAPSALEVKGKISGVSTISRKAKLVFILVVAIVFVFVISATVTGWQQAGEGPVGAEKEDAGSKSIETADVGRLMLGVSDGQGSAAAPPAVEVDDVAGTAALGKSAPGVGTAVPGKGKSANAAATPRIGALDGSGGMDLSGTTSPEAERARKLRDARYQLDDSAKRASIDISWGGGRSGSGDGGSGAGSDSNDPASALNRLQKQLSSIAAAGAQSPATLLAAAQRASGQEGAVAVDDPNKQIRKEQFMRMAEGQPDSGYLNQVKKAALGQCELKASQVIPSTLKCGINTDLPGMLCAEVRENVYDHKTGRKLLVPQGTTIIGSYDPQVAIGQRRVLAAWQKLVFPDDSTLMLQGMPGTDQAGMAGFDADVDNHYSRIALTTGMMTLFSAGFQLSQSRNQVPNAAPSAGQTIANSVGQNIAQFGNAEAQKQLNVQPTLTRGPGYRFNILITKDIVFPCPKTSS